METKHFVTSRVGSDDFVFLKKLFPMTTGLTDKIISTLFKKFIDELRIAAANEQLEPAWYVESPTYRSINEFLERFQRCTFGLAAGSESPRDDAGAVDSIHQTVLSPEVVSTNTKSKSKSRRRSNKKES